jgi:hypothetical protein
MLKHPGDSARASEDDTLGQPKHGVAAWSNADVLRWLSQCDLGEFKDAFAAANITGSQLSLLLAIDLLRIGVAV